MNEQDDLTGGLKVVPGVDFPLPPADLADRLDNSGDDRPAASALPEAKAMVLEYVDEHPYVVVPLKWPFRLDGEVVRSITVQRLDAETASGIFVSAGQPYAVAGAPVQPVGFGPEIDGLAWEAFSVTHDIEPERGWTTTIETRFAG